MKGIAWGNWDPREVQQYFQPYPNGVEDRTTRLSRLLIGAKGKELNLLVAEVGDKSCGGLEIMMK